MNIPLNAEAYSAVLLDGAICEPDRKLELAELVLQREISLSEAVLEITEGVDNESC